MTDARPAPLVPAEVDLRDFPFTPMFRARLFGSEFHANANDTEWRAGVTLWLKSWDQVPAGTLPTDDVSLCRLAELGRDMRTWCKIKPRSMHGWIECSDGRMYHRVVAEGVLEAWDRKLAQRDRTEKARAARLAKLQSQTETSNYNGSVTHTVTDQKTRDFASKGQGQGQGQGQGDTPSLRSGGARAKRRTSLPENCPSEVAKNDAVQFWGVHARFDLAETVDDEAEQFRDHHLKIGSVMADWNAAWRTWYRNTINPKFSRAAKVSAHDKGTQGAAIFLAEVERSNTSGHRNGIGEIGTGSRVLPAGHGREEMGDPVPDLLRRSPRT